VGEGGERKREGDREVSYIIIIDFLVYLFYNKCCLMISL
jgi:hypothetical protein